MQQIRGRCRADGRLQRRAHPHGRRGARRVDGQQPGPLQGQHRRPGRSRISRGDALAVEVLAGGRRGEHGPGNRLAVQQRGQRKLRPGSPIRCQLPGVLCRQAPGDRRRGQRAGAGRGELRPPPGEVVPVLAAADARADDHRGGLGQRRRLAAQLAGQADRAAALVRVRGQPARQVVQRLPRAERGHRENPHPVLTGDRRGVRGGDQHPAGRPGRHQPVQVRRIPQVIEHHQPRPAGPLQPGQEPGRHRLGITAVIQPQLRGGLPVAGQHRRPAGRGHPGQQIHPA